MVLLVVAAAILVSLGGIVMAMLNPDPHHRAVTPVLVAATLAIGWLLMHSMFVPHYAHRHFAAEARKDGSGFGFPGEPPRS